METQGRGGGGEGHGLAPGGGPRGAGALGVLRDGIAVQHTAVTKDGPRLRPFQRAGQGA